MSAITRRLGLLSEQKATLDLTPEFEEALRVFCREWSAKMAARSNGRVSAAVIMNGLTQLLAECAVIGRIEQAAADELQMRMTEFGREQKERR